MKGAKNVAPCPVMWTTPVPCPRNWVGMSSTVYWRPEFIAVVVKKRLAMASTVINMAEAE